MRQLAQWVLICAAILAGCEEPQAFVYEAPATLLVPQVPPEDLERSERHHIPTSLAHDIRLAALRHNIPIPIAFSLVRTESSFTPSALSWAGAIGLTQVMPPTGLAHCGYTPDELYDTYFNLDCGFSFLRMMHDRYGSWPLALMAYHRGPTRLTRELSRGLGHGLSVDYARGILANADGS